MKDKFNRTTITLGDKHRHYIKNTDFNFSAFCRQKIEERMESDEDYTTNS